MRELHCLWLCISSRITYRFFKAAAAAPACSQIHTHIYLYVVCVWVCGDSALLLASIISHTQGHLQQSQSKRKVEDGRGEAEWVGRLKEKMDLFKKKKKKRPSSLGSGLLFFYQARQDDTPHPTPLTTGLVSAMGCIWAGWRLETLCLQTAFLIRQSN